MDTGLIRPYSVIQWRCQWSTFCGWPAHSMCSCPHFTGKPDWPRADFMENCLLRAGSKASAVSRFRQKLSPMNGVQGITAISRKNALLGVMSAKLAKWVAKKWGPTCDRDISDSAIYTTVIYRAYTVSDKCLDFDIFISLVSCQWLPAAIPYTQYLSLGWPGLSIWPHPTV